MLSNLTKWWINQARWVREEWLGSLGVFSIEMAKRMSPSRPSTLNRRPNEIELLGSNWALCARTRCTSQGDWMRCTQRLVMHRLPRVHALNVSRVIPMASCHSHVHLSGDQTRSPRVRSHVPAPPSQRPNAPKVDWTHHRHWVWSSLVRV
jgi:hypothetical protein